MGVLKFQLPSPDLARLRPHLRKAYVTGLDRTPEPARRRAPSGPAGLPSRHQRERPAVRPLAVEGLGVPIVGTATLGERLEPYDLAVELARGRLNEVRNQLADWVQMGLRTTPELDRLMAESQPRRSSPRRWPATPPTSRTPPPRRAWPPPARRGPPGRGVHPPGPAQPPRRHAQAADLPRRRPRRATPSSAPGPTRLGPSFNAAQLPCSWKAIAPTEGKYRWDQFDAQLAWCRKHRLAIQAGPVLEFRPARPARLDLALGGGLRLDPRVRRRLTSARS